MKNMKIVHPLNKLLKLLLIRKFKFDHTVTDGNETNIILSFSFIVEAYGR